MIWRSCTGSDAAQTVMLTSEEYSAMSSIA